MFEITGKKLSVLIDAEKIRARIAALGAEITADYRGAGEVVVIGVLKGSFVFMADLVRAIELPITIEFIGIQSYGDETSSSGVVQITSDLTKPIDGKHVIVVEDIIDTGLTVAYLLENLTTRHPASVKVCALLHKPERQVKKVAIDYLGFTIPNQFVVGYGLDFAQKFRNLPFIGLVEGAAE